VALGGCEGGSQRKKCDSRDERDGGSYRFRHLQQKLPQLEPLRQAGNEWFQRFYPLVYSLLGNTQTKRPVSLKGIGGFKPRQLVAP